MYNDGRSDAPELLLLSNSPSSSDVDDDDEGDKGQREEKGFGFFYGGGGGESSSDESADDEEEDGEYFEEDDDDDEEEGHLISNLMAAIQNRARLMRAHMLVAQSLGIIERLDSERRPQPPTQTLPPPPPLPLGHELLYDSEEEDLADEIENTQRAAALTYKWGECCVCCEPGEGMVDLATGRTTYLTLSRVNSHFLDVPADLTEYRAGLNQEFLADKFLVAGACERPGHDMCVRCIRHICTRKDVCMSLLVQGKGFLPCLHSSTEECNNALGQRNVWPDVSMRNILTLAECSQFYEWASSVRKTVENPLPSDAYNHYFDGGPAMRSERVTREYPGMFFHEAVNAVDVADQLNAIVRSEKVELYCRQCYVPLEHSSMCNTLTHCCIDMCNICGRCDFDLDNDLSHWKSKNNPHGCPRYSDDDPELKEMGYLCCEGKCFTDTEPCTLKEHAEGRKNYLQFRKQKQCEGLWNSLSSSTKTQVMPLLFRDTKEFLQRNVV